MDKSKRLLAVPYAFIPMPLFVDDAPELEVFPLNIMFVSLSKIDGLLKSGTALYEPDLTNYRNENGMQYLTYVNKYMEHDYIDVCYNRKKKSYEADKYVRGKHAGYTIGTSWKQFFIHLTMSGLSPGEGCTYDIVKS